MARGVAADPLRGALRMKPSTEVIDVEDGLGWRAFNRSEMSERHAKEPTVPICVHCAIKMVLAQPVSKKPPLRTHRLRVRRASSAELKPTLTRSAAFLFVCKHGGQSVRTLRSLLITAHAGFS